MFATSNNGATINFTEHIMFILDESLCDFTGHAGDNICQQSGYDEKEPIFVVATS